MGSLAGLLFDCPHASQKSRLLRTELLVVLKQCIV